MRCVIYPDLRCLSRGSCNNTWWAFLCYFLLAFNPSTSPPSLYFQLKRNINVSASWDFFSVELRGMALLPLFSMLFSLPFPSHLVKIIEGFQNVSISIYIMMMQESNADCGHFWWKNVCPEMKQCSGKHPAVVCSPLFSAEILNLSPVLVSATDFKFLICL